MSTIKIRTRGSSNDIGPMECYWKIDAALDFIKQQFKPLPEGVLETARSMSTTPLASIEDTLHQKENIAISRARELFLELAPEAFFQAQWQLIADIALILFQEFEVSVNTLDGKVTFNPAGRELINKERATIEKTFQRIHHKRVGIVPGRPDDPLSEDVVVYYKEVLVKVKKAKVDISAYGLDMEMFQEEEVFADLNKHPDLMERLFKTGRESQPAYIAREYTIRQFGLNLSEGALEKALQRKGKKTK